MVFDISTALTWILFLAMFPIAFYWYRHAWRVFIKKDYSDVAVKGGKSPQNPRKFAPFVGILNLLGGLILTYDIIGVVFMGLPYETWSAIAGSTIWMKIIFDFIIRRHAHMEPWGRKKK
ncbi:hypothetical protein [Polynucleobacter sp. es-EL-1]|jgi:hypothetical protein|uniref:hypothetical protein n=1 Tax=Polynucleobacter sp. es-EL-1 TaxID=1855652 RepID=UPI001BFED03B|nr:hypothetical protein [Polynucleobacter sp. es-EL-1]QWE10359.1 hypothetical protein FD974_08445 [Polynucleobacter sp. es-EL-1]HQS61448.1 hypothetical protein [Polynucleobacter sp.]HQT21026.1 hypothetical protein [Polynucleobacter sp.]HQT41913.1 hypothetical protein [Polynucleobacter sp.]